MSVQIEVEGKTVFVTEAVKMVVENDDCKDVALSDDGSCLILYWDYDNSQPVTTGTVLLSTHHHGERAYFSVPFDAEF